MAISGVSGSTAPDPVTSPTASADPKKALGQDAFLKLLMAELQNQDPTKPMDDTAFITQMATFTSLDKLTSISTATGDMDTSLKSLNQLVAASLLQAAPASVRGGSN